MQFEFLIPQNKFAGLLYRFRPLLASDLLGFWVEAKV